MLTRLLPPNGQSVHSLGIGSLPLKLGEDRVVALMERLLDAGCNLVDTAACYPGSEDAIGRRLAHRRDEFLIVSKCGHHEILPDGSMRSLAISMDDIDAALQRLRTDCIDALLLHSYDLEPLQQGDAIAVLEAAKAAGKVRMIGYSGDNERAAWAVASGRFDVLEISVSIADQACCDEILPAAAAAGMAVIAKRPVANAAWARGRQLDQVHESVRIYHDRLQRLALIPEAYGCADMAELALRFTLSQPGVTCAIASSTSEANQDRNLAAAAVGPLATDALQRLRSRWHAMVGDDWQGVN